MTAQKSFSSKFLINLQVPQTFPLIFGSLEIQSCNDLTWPKFSMKVYSCNQEEEIFSSKDLLRQSQEIREQEMRCQYQQLENSQNILFHFDQKQQDKQSFPFLTLNESLTGQQPSQNALGSISPEKQVSQYQGVKIESLKSSFSYSNKKNSLTKEIQLQSKFSCQYEKDENKFILNQVNIKCQKGKNTNFPKYSIRLLQDYFQAQLNEERFQGEVKEKLDQVIRKILRIKYGNFSKNLALLFSLLKDGDSRQQDEQFQKEAKKISRKIMRKILREKGMKQIIKNNRMTTKKTQLICSKVYALRCMMSSLTQRLQSA